jgi:hypothetical protein
MLLNPTINFNLVKNIISLCFHEYKNSKLTHFSSISKEAKFRVLQCCPSLCVAFGRAPLGWGTALAHKMTWACGEWNVMVELEVNAHVIIVVELAVEV